jgi:hypothetical protein
MPNQDLPERFRYIVDAVTSWHCTFPIDSIDHAFAQLPLEGGAHQVLRYRGQSIDLDEVKNHFGDADLPIASREELISAIANKELTHDDHGLTPLRMGRALGAPGGSPAGRLLGAGPSALRLTVVDAATGGPLEGCRFNLDYFVEADGVYTVLSQPGQWLYCECQGFLSAWGNVLDYRSAHLPLEQPTPKIAP